ncbi:hypothetical protein LMG23994_05819 [Cupriavidus pinatubonensis]|uniref:Uncharacterized protein n=1 Tax=Cupriavidus pinatubonensis TaxID=248026 RepID=A0ABM8XYV5_9BURK|nr:hypothetical protein LMG23994_05819 [Cupriavidus pinatubonensis]
MREPASPFQLATGLVCREIHGCARRLAHPLPPQLSPTSVVTPQGPHDVRKLSGVRPMRMRVRRRRGALLTRINPAHLARATFEQTVPNQTRPCIGLGLSRSTAISSLRLTTAKMADIFTLAGRQWPTRLSATSVRTSMGVGGGSGSLTGLGRRSAHRRSVERGRHRNGYGEALIGLCLRASHYKVGSPSAAGEGSI